MSGFFMHSLEIKEYKQYLIIKLVKRTPKINLVGAGTSLINFNKNDLHISKEAAELLKSKVAQFNNELGPVMEIMSSSNLWYTGYKGLIIPPNEVVHIYEMPVYTECDNEIDEVLKNTLNNS